MSGSKPCQHALALITKSECVDVNLEDFVHDYYSVERFKNAYKRIIEPMPDRTQWPQVDLPFMVGAPLDKRGRGRYKKLRIKSCLEGENSKGKKAAEERGKEADKEATKEADMEAEKQNEKGKKKMIRGKRKCKRCGELGHGETSYKCPLNGTKKRKRKTRKNTCKYGDNAKLSKKGKKHAAPTAAAAADVQDCPIVVEENAIVAVQEAGAAALQEDAIVAVQHSAIVAVQNCPIVVQSPAKPTRETILQDSPIRVTRSSLAMLLGEGATSPQAMPPSPGKKKPRKLTPKKLKTM